MTELTDEQRLILEAKRVGVCDSSSFKLLVEDQNELVIADYDPDVVLEDKHISWDGIFKKIGDFSSWLLDVALSPITKLFEALGLKGGLAKAFSSIMALGAVGGVIFLLFAIKNKGGKVNVNINKE